MGLPASFDSSAVERELLGREYWPWKLESAAVVDVIGAQTEMTGARHRGHGNLMQLEVFLKAIRN